MTMPAINDMPDALCISSSGSVIYWIELTTGVSVLAFKYAMSRSNASQSKL